MEWIDPEFSRRVAKLAGAGEGQSVEFKREFPEQARELAKDIAVFASSNDGVILIGVDDRGNIVGLPDADQATNRDALAKRVAGICRDIEPPVRPELKWASIDGKYVLGIEVVRGPDPIYYADHRPYIRHATSNRPAKSSEVYQAVKAHVESSKTASSQPSTNQSLSALAAVLVKILRWLDTDSNIRDLKPWSDQWTWDAESSASTIRDLAAEDEIANSEMEHELRAFAAALDDVVNFRHTYGSGADFRSVCSKLREIAAAMMEKYIDPVPVSEETQESVKQMIAKGARKLTDLWSRAAAAPFTNIVPDAQRESGELGRQLAQFSYYRLSFLSPEQREALRKIGLRLFALEAQTMYHDGGDSQRRAIAEGESCGLALTDLVAQFSPSGGH